MKTGETVKSFTAKDGREVILRTLKWEDLDDLIDMMNSLIEEGADITLNQKLTKEQETDWLARKLAEIEKGKAFMIGAEVDGKIVATSEFNLKSGYSTHVGDLGIVIRKGHRDVGIGSEMLKILVSQAEKMGLKMLTLSVFSTNQRAKHVYEKVGFKEIGCIPNKFLKNGKFIDEIIMIKQLTDLKQGL